MAGGAAEGLQIRVELAALDHRRQLPPRLLPRRHSPRETASPPIPDELLLDIFHRISDPADLVCTSAACLTFRRLITDRSFLRRYRKLHAPPLIGLLSRRLDGTRRVFHPAVAPHPSAPSASAVALAADFSFSFLPGPASDWEVQDVRDGRVLLDRPRSQHHSDWLCRNLTFWEITVCDPFNRRYLVLPQIPGDQAAAAVEDPVWIIEAFLIPLDNDEETSFRVVLMGQAETKLFTFVFSSSTGQWRAGPLQHWRDLLAGSLSSTANTLFYFRRYTYGCFYWVTSPYLWREEMKMLVFDTQRMQLSIVEPPPEAKSYSGFDVNMAMVEAGEGRPGMFMLETSPSNPSLHYTIMQNNAGSSGDWHREKTISLPPGSWYLLPGSVERYVLMVQWGGSSPEQGFFTLDIKTFQLESVCAEQAGHAYSNFPPCLLTSPTVSSGVEEVLLENGVEALRAEEWTGTWVDDEKRCWNKVRRLKSPWVALTTPADANTGDRAGVSRTGGALIEVVLPVDS